MKSCGECKRDVSEDAPMFPGCGAAYSLIAQIAVYINNARGNWCVVSRSCWAETSLGRSRKAAGSGISAAYPATAGSAGSGASVV